jgi:hypothetical protein
MTRTQSITIAFVVCAILPATAMAQVSKPAPKPRPRVETQAQLQAEAKVSVAAATATAQQAVPNGKIGSHELEREKGKLIYSFDIKVAGKSGIEEVNVDAMTGALIEKVHETPADEAREAAADKKTPARPPVKKP